MTGAHDLTEAAQPDSPGIVRSSDGLASKPPKRAGLGEWREEYTIRVATDGDRYMTTCDQAPGLCIMGKSAQQCLDVFEATLHRLHSLDRRTADNHHPNRAAGGKARAIVLTAQRRKEIAVKIAKARWAK